MKNYFYDFIFKVRSSFLLSLKGEEELKVIVRWWGVLGYLFFYFVVNKIVKVSPLPFVYVPLSLLAVIYFSWHIFALKKCEPKKPKLSKEEKKKKREQFRKELPRRFLRKLFLQESISKWNTVTVMIALDLLYILVFLEYVLG